MTEVKKTNWNQLIQSFPYTFSKETFLNTPLAGHKVTIHRRSVNSWLSWNEYYVIILKDDNIVSGCNSDKLDECIQYIRCKCEYYEQKIKLERNMLFDTPIEA
jgi:hypothetical protein